MIIQTTDQVFEEVIDDSVRFALDHQLFDDSIVFDSNDNFRMWSVTQKCDAQSSEMSFDLWPHLVNENCVHFENEKVEFEIRFFENWIEKV